MKYTLFIIAIAMLSSCSTLTSITKNVKKECPPNTSCYKISVTEPDGTETSAYYTDSSKRIQTVVNKLKAVTNN